MSYVALATLRYEEMCRFYGGRLLCPVLDGWDRPTARARVFDLFGLRLEILDASREQGLRLPDPGDRIHLVVEVDDPSRYGTPVETSWGGPVVLLRDPDGVALTFVGRKRAAPVEGGPSMDA